MQKQSAGELRLQKGASNRGGEVTRNLLEHKDTWTMLTIGATT